MTTPQFTEPTTVSEAAPAPEPPPPADPLAPDENAPFGYMKDAVTGQIRPKKRPGKQKGPTAPTSGVNLDDLKAAKNAGDEDRSPDAKRKMPGQRRAKKPEAPLPPFREGVIAKQMNGLYRKVGRFVRVMDPDVGNAIIQATKAYDEDDVTVGQAWEEIARTNPRIRRFLMKLAEGGAWSQLFWAHAPIFLAVLMKDGIRSRIPFGNLLTSLFETDESDETAEAGPAGGLADVMAGLQPGDVSQMMDLAQQMMGQMAANVPRSSGVRVPTAADVTQSVNADWDDSP